jgi:outer membrane protein assembly factor BamB
LKVCKPASYRLFSFPDPEALMLHVHFPIFPERIPVNMNCPECNAANQSGSKFCEGCGAALAEEAGGSGAQSYCARCGSPGLEGDAFCQQCGAQITQSTPSMDQTPAKLAAHQPAVPTTGKQPRKLRNFGYLALLAFAIIAGSIFWLFSFSGSDQQKGTTMSRANAQRTGEYDAGKALTGTKKWETGTKGSANKIFETDGKIYLSSSERPGQEKDASIKTSTNSNNLLTSHLITLDANSGSQISSFDLVGETLVPLIVSNGVVYAIIPKIYGGEKDDDWNQLVAISLDDRKELWRFETSDIQGLVIDDNTLYLTAKSQPSYLYALDAGTGKQIWKYETALYPQVPTAGDGLVYFSAYGIGPGNEPQSTIFAIDAKSGTEVWKFNKDMDMGEISIADGKVFVELNLHRNYTSQDYLYAFDAKSGREQWKITTGQTTGQAVADGIVYFADYESGNASDTTNARINAVDTKSGKRLWQKVDNSALKNFSFNLMVANEVVYYKTNSNNNLVYTGKIQALDGKSGEEKWKYELSNPTQEELIAGDGAMYLLGFPQSKQDTGANNYILTALE